MDGVRLLVHTCACGILDKRHGVSNAASVSLDTMTADIGTDRGFEVERLGYSSIGCAGILV